MVGWIGAGKPRAGLHAATATRLLLPPCLTKQRRTWKRTPRQEGGAVGAGNMSTLAKWNKLSKAARMAVCVCGLQEDLKKDFA